MTSDTVIQEGFECPNKCGGTLVYPVAEHCTCHLSAPCCACLDEWLHCDLCGWEEGDEVESV